MLLVNQFSSQQRVIVCRKEDSDPTETLGYYGVVVRILAEAKIRYPEQPDMWDYRVFVPFLNRKVTVPGRILVATGILGDSMDDLDWKICFDTIPTDNNHEISGSYRIPNSGTTYFSFQKTESAVATYRLVMQMATSSPEFKLFFSVPCRTKLTADYVRASIRRILGLPPDELPECNATEGSGW
ncbi:MAG: hypothetical protein ABI557_03385 [Aureliella sp.]